MALRHTKNLACSKEYTKKTLIQAYHSAYRKQQDMVKYVAIRPGRNQKCVNFLIDLVKLYRQYYSEVQIKQ